MKLRIPRADALALGSAIAALIAIVNELHWEHPVKQAVIVALALVSALVVNPLSSSETSSASSSSTGEEVPPIAGATKRPEAPAAEDGQPI